MLFVAGLTLALPLLQLQPAQAQQAAGVDQLVEQIRQTDEQLLSLKNTIDRNTLLREELQEAFTQALQKRQERDERLSELSLRIDDFDSRIVELELAVSKAQASIDQRKATLASALRSAQKLGESSPLKRLLQHDDPAQANRLNVYREYLFEAQQQTVTSAVRYLEKLEQAKHSAQKDRNWLNYIRDKASGQRLEHDQRALDKRQQIIIVEEQLQDQTRSVAQLQLDQQRLQQLMLELEAKRRDGAGYFASLQGQLDLPAVGELKARFGQTKSVGKLKWDGWFIAAQSGTPVRAVADGEVVYSNWLEGFGMLVILDHGDNYLTLYGGNRDVMAQTGTWVTAGSTIAQVGDSGGQNTSGLYFEIRRNARALDPEKWLKAASS